MNKAQPIRNKIANYHVLFIIIVLNGLAHMMGIIIGFMPIHSLRHYIKDTEIVILTTATIVINTAILC